jgi:hypothetical protein
MDPDDGATLTLRLSDCPPSLVAAMREGFDAGLDVRVTLSEGGKAVTRVEAK